MDDDVPVWRLTDGELTAAWLASEKAMRREYARTLSLIGEIEGRGLAVSKGYRDTAALVAVSVNLSGREAKRRVAHATTPMSRVGAALAAGTINPEHVAEIHHVLTQAPATVDEAARDDAERTLVDLATVAPAASVRKAGCRLLTYWDVEGKKPNDRERELAGPYRVFRYFFTSDGQMHFDGQVDAETAASVVGMFHTLAKPIPAKDNGGPDPRTARERQGDAFAEIIGLAARTPDLPVVGGDSVVVTVTVSLEELENRAGSAFIDGIGYTSVSDLRRRCCDAKVVPVVLGGAGEVLDVGRARRLATSAQRRALAVRDGGCCRPGCSRAPKWCTPHHLRHWVDGGPTELSNLVLVCPHHHRELHHTEWQVRMRHGIPEFVPPKWLDQQQKPIRNIAHHTSQHHPAA